MNTGAFGDLATSLSSRVTSIEDARNRFAKITEFPGWSGSAKDAAKQSFQNIDQSLLDDVARVSAVRETAAELQSDFAQLQAELKALEREADSLGASIDDNGFVHDKPGAQITDAQRARIANLSAETSEIIRAAERLDEKAAEVLKKAAEGTITAGGATNDTDAAQAGEKLGELGVPDPPPGSADPDYNTGWWNGLTKDQQQWVIDNHPDWIGNRDGVSATARDAANRKLLPGEITRLQAEVDRLQKKLDGEFGHGKFSNTDSDLYWAKRRLEGAQAIQGSLDKYGKDAKLMVLDMNYGTRGRAAIALGDPDTADHISVAAPGVNSSPGQSMAGMTDEAAALKRETERILDKNGHGNETVSTIAWIGYEPPQAVLDPSKLTPDEVGKVGPGGYADEAKGLANVASDAQAKAGASSLSRFYEGLNSAWHPAAGDANTGPHITALGHSYGSLTTSLALQQTPPGVVENVVFYGSPGIEASSAQQLHIGAGHVFAMQTDDDPIRYVPNLTEHYGANPTEMPWITRLSTHAGDTTADAPVGSPDGTTIHHDGASGHSEYPRDGGGGQLRMPGYNMAVVVAGMTGEDSGHQDKTVRGD